MQKEAAVRGREDRPDVLDWFVRIHAGRHALGSNYTVLIYLGEPPASPDDWRSSPNLVGSHAVLKGGFGGGDGEIIEGFVHLNKALAERHILSESEGHIEAYIKDKINWRILKVSVGEAPANTSTQRPRIWWYDLRSMAMEYQQRKLPISRSQ